MREQPFFRRFNDAWYVQIGQKQIKLCAGPKNQQTRAEAYRKFAELIAGDVARLEDPSKLTVAQVCDVFLDHVQKHAEATTYDYYRYFLQSFCTQSGTLRVRTLKPLHITKWMDGHAWNPTSRFSAASCVKRAFHYAIDQGLLKENPLAALKKDQPLRRERLVEDAERKQIFAAIRDREFREFLFAMQETGARPKEIRTLTRERVDLSAGVWVFPPRRHKTGKKTGKPRVIYLNPAMIELMKELLERHKEGCLFRNTRGKPWTKDAIVQRMDHLRQKFPTLQGVVAYCYRHSFTTDGLERGVPIATMAELLGHTSTRMIEQHYSHLTEKREHLRQAVLKVTARECASADDAKESA